MEVKVPSIHFRCGCDVQLQSREWIQGSDMQADLCTSYIALFSSQYYIRGSQIDIYTVRVGVKLYIFNAFLADIQMSVTGKN